MRCRVRPKESRSWPRSWGTTLASPGEPCWRGVPRSLSAALGDNCSNLRCRYRCLLESRRFLETKELPFFDEPRDLRRNHALPRRIALPHFREHISREDRQTAVTEPAQALD